MNLENAIIILEILTFLEGATFVQNSHVQNSKFHIDEDIQSARDFVINERHVRRHSNGWRPRRRSDAYFSGWTAWSHCDSSCKRRRERYCKVKRKCGLTKHIEENQCRRCPRLFHPSEGVQFKSHSPSKTPVVNRHQIRLPVFQEIHANIDEHSGSGDDFYVLKTPKRRRIKKKRKPILVDVDDYEDLEDEDDDGDDDVDVYYPKSNDGINRSQNKSRLQKNGKRNLGIDADSMEYDEMDLEEFPTYQDDDYETEYEMEDLFDNKNASRLPAKEKSVVDPVPRHRRIYSKWSKWTKCSPKCTTRRYKKCRLKEQCGREVLREIAYCYTEGSFCQQWLNAQLQKSQPYEVRPTISRRKDTVGTSNSIVGDFIMSGKGYRGPEYTPMKLKCGIAPIKSLKRNVYSMLKIIGGRAARKGEWPWQVAILNRFREAFCGGTLIAPQWILTAAHCVRKVLYVKLGEHNLYHDDGTELQFRVAKSFKHPNFDKKTVDSDIALLRLPKPVNATTWVGFSCLPRPYQALPRDMECTVIGWGKRRSRDQSGTNVLHQAEVPIIPMENCRLVYHDYTITKNMFCAGHRQGRIDTCAGDSGGPLLCRDKTKANHPWTIFGITSFGDGCAKRNKFGIYAKVSNYVDWIWSVVNCNGNCKAHIPKRY